MNDYDLDRAETACMDKLESGRWTRVRTLPADALHTLIDRGYVERSRFADEWARLTGAGHAEFETCA